MSPRLHAAKFAFVSLLLLACVGCGSIREQRATDQLLLSDAVDRSVSMIDFAALANENVYLDSRYLQFKNDAAVTTNYVISALRQQMVVAGCLLQDRIEEADYVVEARVGTLGADGHEINYGIPASNSVNQAASLFSGSPALPALPEVSLARKTEDMAAVKIAAFAYARSTKMPVWQSGTSIARSTATGTWILGAGPFKNGTIYDRSNQLAGSPQGRLDPNNDREQLDREYVYHGKSTWDPKLREKVETGQHLLPPVFEEETAVAEKEGTEEKR